MRVTLPNFMLPPTGGLRLYDEILREPCIDHSKREKYAVAQSADLWCPNPTPYRCAILTYLLGAKFLIYLCNFTELHRLRNLPHR